MKEQLKKLKELCIIMYCLQDNKITDAADKNYINSFVNGCEQNLLPYIGDVKNIDFKELKQITCKNDAFTFNFDSGEICFYNGDYENHSFYLKLIFSDELYKVMKKYFQNQCDKFYGEIGMKRFNEQIILDRIALKLESLDYDEMHVEQI